MSVQTSAQTAEYRLPPASRLCRFASKVCSFYVRGAESVSELGDLPLRVGLQKFPLSASSVLRSGAEKSLNSSHLQTATQQVKPAELHTHSFRSRLAK